MTQALKGIRILDFTHVQSGPTCTQLLAWFGADVIKVERPGVGDITRGQLMDVPDADALYFTMLNHNKRSITLIITNIELREISLVANPANLECRIRKPSRLKSRKALTKPARTSKRSKAE